jgi:hypothetical protein
MGKRKRRLLLALVLVLLLVSTLYYLNSSFLARKARVAGEKLLVRKGIRKSMVEGMEGEGREVRDERSEEVVKPFAPHIPGEEAETAAVEAEVEAVSERLGRVHRVKEPEKVSRRGIEARKGEAGVTVKKETSGEKRRPSAEKPPLARVKRVTPERREKRAAPPLRVATCAECEGVPISHRKLALLLCEGLHLGSNLSYHQAVMALRGLGISPRAGWNEADPSFPVGAEELDEILDGSERAISTGLVSANYPELTNRLRQYCAIERAYMVVGPQCEGPMVTECRGYCIPQCDLAIYLSKVLGIGEDLDCDQCFSLLTALNISPRRGWRVEQPYTLVTPREIEEVRCSVREAYVQGLVATDLPTVVSSINDYCLWLKMNIQVLGEPTFAETVAQTSYQAGGGGRISIPKGGEVASASE